MPGIELTPGTWEDTEAMLGKEFSRAGADAVDLGSIRRRLEVLSFDSPLYRDEETARRCGYEGIPLPVSMIAAWSLPAYWRPGDPPLGTRVVMPAFPLVQIPGPGTAVMGSNVDSEYFEPVYVGDRIACVYRLVSVTPKRTRLGEGAFLVVETTYRKQTGEVVCIDRYTHFRYTPAPEQEGEAGTTGGPSFEDAGQGERIPPYSVDLTLQRLVMECGVNRDYAPMHFDRDAVRAEGVKDLFANTMLLQALFEVMLRQWMGPAGRIRKMAFRMHALSYVNETLTAHGIVAARSQQDAGSETVELKIWQEASGRRTVSGTAGVERPLRGVS
jgi:acyl dehydratase